MAIDVRITDVPFSEVPDHEAKVFINDGGKLRQTDLTTIAKYSKLYELIIGAHDTAMGEITQQLESGQLGMAEAFDSYMSQLNATHAHLDLALEELKGEIEDDMTQRAETMTAEYTAMRNEYTGLFSENTEALEKTRKNIDEQIQTGTDSIAQQSQDVLAQLTGLFNNSTASLQNTKNELEAALNAKHTDIVDDLDEELAQHIEACNDIHASYKAEMEQIITNGQADIQRIIDNVGDLSEAVATLNDLKDDVEAIETELDSLREEMKDNAGLQEHLTASNPHGITKSDVGLSNVVNERQYSASNPQPSVQRVAFTAGSSDVERPILVGSENTSGQNVYSASGITANYAQKTLTAPGGFKGNADSATTLVGLTASIDELNNLGKSVADGKELLATTISNYNVKPVASDATFAELHSSMVKTITSVGTQNYIQGVNESRVGDAAAENVLAGKTFTNASGSGLTGTMPDKSGWYANTSGSSNVTIPAGYHDGTGYISGSGAYNAGITYATNAYYCPNGNSVSYWSLAQTASGTSPYKNPCASAYHKGRMYVCMNKSVFYSTNGTSWVKCSADLPYNGFYIVVADNGNMVVSTVDNGIYVSTNSGETWTSTFASGCKMVAIKKAGGAIYAYGGLTGVSGNGSFNGLYWSVDGTGWNSVSSGNITNTTSILEVEHVASAYGSAVVATGYSYVWYSIKPTTNYEFTNFTQIPNLTISTGACVYLDPDTQRLYIGGRGYIWFANNTYSGFSNANGTSWTKVALPSTNAMCTDMRRLGSYWYFATSEALYRCTTDPSTSVTFTPVLSPNKSYVQQLHFIHKRLYVTGQGAYLYSAKTVGLTPSAFATQSTGIVVAMFEAPKYAVLVTTSGIFYSKALY